MHNEILFFIIGLIFGSFANVCIYRLPIQKSIVKPRSKCTLCKKPIPWFHNIPVLSFLFILCIVGYVPARLSRSLITVRTGLFKKPDM